MDRKDSATHRLHKAYWASSRLWFVPWLLLAGDVSLALLLLERSREGWQPLLGSSLLVCILCSLAWLRYLGWYGPWSRAARWWMVQAQERVRGWLGQRAAALLFILVSFTLLAGGLAGDWFEQLGWVAAVGYALSLVFAVMLVAAFLSLYVMRKRLVILPFKIYRAGRPEGSSEDAEAGEELASRLRSEIAAIISVYQVIDDVSPTGRTIEATVSVEDTGKDLRDALGPDSRFKLWSVDIPVGALMGLFGWLLRGPRLMGAVHHGGREVLLTAFLSGGPAPGNWRVSSKDLADEHGWMDLRSPGWREPVSPGPGADSSALVSDLARQLAYRVVAQVVTTGSPRWEAVYHYTEGLSAYRRTIRTGRERELFLHQAERAFVRALGCDQKFAQCYYNLGIVYRDLGKLEAAESSFRRALQENPASVDAAYAIALSRFKAGKYQEAVSACGNAIRIRSQDARAWKLRGWAKRRDLEEKEKSVPLPAGHAEWAEIIRDREIGAALAWKALCRTRRGTDSREAQRWLAAAATLNSGISLCLTGRRRRGDRRLWQALSLSLDIPILRFEVGKTWCQARQWQRALPVLEALPANVLPPADQPALLLYRLNARLASGGAETEKAEEDYRQLLDRVAAMQPGGREELLEDRRAVGELSAGAEDPLSKWRLTPVLIFLEKLQRKSGESPEACRGRLHRQETEERDEWRRAQVRVRLAEECLLEIAVAEERVGPNEGRLALLAETCLKKAIATLESGQRFHQIQARGLRSRLAQALVVLAESEPGRRSFYLTKALRQADRAVNEEPEGAAQRLALGEVYAALQDYLQAEDELTTSLQLDYLGSTAGKLAEACWNRGATLRDARGRKMDLSTVSHMLDNALCATEIQSVAGKDAGDQIRQHGGIHARLGAFYREGLQESDYDQAIYHQRIAVALGYRPVESRVELGWTYLQAKDYARADALFHEALVEIERSGAALNLERVRALLGRALLRAERALDLEEAERFAQQASAFLDKVEGPRQGEVHALYHRCMGVLRYQTAYRASRSGEPRFEKEIDEALRELERAAVLDSSAAVQEWLALVYGVKGGGPRVATPLPGESPTSMAGSQP